MVTVLKTHLEQIALGGALWSPVLCQLHAARPLQIVDRGRLHYLSHYVEPAENKSQ